MSNAASISVESVGYSAPAFYALALHVLLVLVLVGFPSEQEDAFVPKPRAIQATLLTLEEVKPTKTAPVAKPKPKLDPEPAVVPEPAVEEPPRETVSEPVDRKESEVDPGIDPSLDEWLDEEAAEFQAEDDQDKVAYYSALIEQQVYRLWSRPPSARNNMEVLLAIRLLPRGDVVSVSVARSSGNSALDRSAVAAVKRADKLSGVAGMEPRLFEQYFREFEMRFRPEDMRL